MSFRKEKKFRVTNADFLAFKNLLLNQGMTTLYEPRKVNSIYFDTKALNMFFDSEEGTLPRKKIRVRWYNEEKKFKLEKKISSIEGRFKTTNVLGHISHENEILNEHYLDQQYGKVVPTLKISYMRSYFSLNFMRITVDENITYNADKPGFQRGCQDPEKVIEIKVPYDCSDDYTEIHIPYATSRFSKYSRGLLLSGGFSGY